MTTVSTNGMHAGYSVEGVVGRSNERGFTLAGRDGYLNYSKFMAVAPPALVAGDYVRVTLDKAGFVRTVDVLTAPVPAPAPSVDTSPVPPSEPAEPVGREGRIVRMNALTNAVALLSSSGRATDLASVLVTAEALEAWVLR